MGNCKGLKFMIGKWVPWSLRTGIIGLLMFAGFAYGDQMGVPETGLLCISDCTTCPVICSPPPHQQESQTPPSPSRSPPPPPPPMHHSPPQSYYTSPPPSPPSPPPPSSPKESQSPPSYSSKGPPPPRFNYYFDFPPSGQVPPTMPIMPGPLHNYDYIYASEASSFSVHAFFLVIFLVHLEFSFW